MLLGRLFVLAAFVRGGRVTELADALVVTAALSSIAQQRSFMMEASTSVILDLCDRLDVNVRAELIASSPEIRILLTTPAGVYSPYL